MQEGRPAAQAGLVLRGLSKTYSGQVALREVDLELKPGEVHALLGHNGSGKSTLIKVLAGYHHPDPGASAWLNGKPITLGSSSAAFGMRFIHQDLGLVPDMSVIDNLALGESYTRRWWLSDRAEAVAARQLLRQFELTVDPHRPLRTLAPALQTVVAVARAMRGDLSKTSVLVLDEPTANLAKHETEILFEAIRRVREQNIAVLYVTHRVHEVFELADTVTVLRDGRRAITSPVDRISPDELVVHIAGRSLDGFHSAPTPASGEDPVLRVSDIHGRDLHGVSFQLRRGEILGIAGISGSGRDALNQVLFGIGELSTGEIVVGDTPLHQPSARCAITAGMAYVPPDRKTLSAIPSMLVRENLTLPRMNAKSLGWLSTRSESRDVLQWLNRLGVTPPAPNRTFSSLSGGNQQKVVLARWLRCGPRVLLLDEPTQGVDLAGKQAIYEALANAARSGIGVVVASSDTEELAEVCDRVLVLRGGRVAAALKSGSNLTTSAIVSATMREAS